jgi:nucleoside-diphosphate-sugar epimerase
MTTIGIIGANGQVGTEVCLFLSQMDDVRVVPICRTDRAVSYLERYGLHPRKGGIDDSEETIHLFEGCDLVADFTLLQGKLSAQRKIIYKISRNAIQKAPTAARYVYVSSMMAYGMSATQSLRRYRLAKTIYGQAKRYGERLVFRLGKEVGREIYILRIGQVHGELQTVSRNILQGFQATTAYVPEGPSYSVFAYTVSEALVNIALGRERPGRYTLISVPQWSWKELFEYYARKLGKRPDVRFFPASPIHKKYSLQAVSQFIKRLTVQPLVNFAIRRRELITGYLLSWFPRVEARIYAIYSCNRAAAEISRSIRRKEDNSYRPFEVRPGRLPGKRMRCLSDSRTTMDSVLPKVEELVRRAQPPAK